MSPEPKSILKNNSPNGPESWSSGFGGLSRAIRRLDLPMSPAGRKKIFWDLSRPENGPSGKTTAITVVSGLYAPDGGGRGDAGRVRRSPGLPSHRTPFTRVSTAPFQVPKPFLWSLDRSPGKHQGLALALGACLGDRPPPSMVTLEHTGLKRSFAEPGRPDLNSARSKKCSTSRWLRLATRPLLLSC